MPSRPEPHQPGALARAADSTVTPLGRARVLVADGLTIFRSALRTLLEQEPDLEVFEAADLDELVTTLGRERIDVVLLDLDLPPLGGLAATEAARAAGAATVIVWALDPPREAVLDAVTAGARGFLDKAIAPDALVRTIRGAMQGEAAITRAVAGLLIDAIHELTTVTRTRERAATLSLRELEVLRMVAEGGRNKEIAARLAISEFTVKRHVQNILQKLGVARRRDAAALYRRAFASDQHVA
jgi:DNA-binding NarL/FixJ family response regulator